MNQIEENDDAFAAVDIKEYFYLLLNWAWLIALAGLLAAIALYVISINTTPLYETSTRLLISDPPAMRSLDTSAMVSTQTQTSTYAEMLLDRPVLQGVIDILKLQTTSDDLKEFVSVEIVRNTQLILVTVQDPNPLQAADIANTLAVVFTDRIRELQSQRYASTQKGLAQQVLEMEKQVNDTTLAISNERDPAQKLQFEARLTQYRQLYSSLVTNFEQVRLAEAQTSTNVFVSEPASVPREPVSPMTTRNTLLAAFAGVLLAAGVIFLIDMLDDTIRNPDDIRQKFNLPVLGVIASHQIVEGKPISMDQPRSPVAEAFRSLRTNITYASVDIPLRRILVTSSTPQEGKTTISSNLAVVLAQGEKKSVLIDADMRRPTVHEKFGLMNRMGLSSLFVRSLENIPAAIQSASVAGLAIITSGSLPPNPAELLTSRRMKDILDRLNQEYDLIVIDTPPVLTVTDAVALAPELDGVIIVARPGMTKLSALRQTLEQLQTVGARVLGVVLNQVDPRSRKYGYYYHRYYSKYSHYYDAEDGKKKKTKGL
ncbi:MAG: polysaccharide biosynthesis tyrosine autokinase [Chloroflexi bacterium]|nr:polysaccharide biosynthesis tyrosine autokinase [Chloroflexota bacterium]